MTLHRALSIAHHFITNPRIFSNAAKVLREEGLAQFIVRTRMLIHGERPYRYTEPEMNENIRAEIASFSEQPLISIIMPVYNIEPKWLDLAIRSVDKQWYRNWELCIADDASTKRETVDYLEKIDHPRIKVSRLEKNLGISKASNEALKLAKGDYIALLDHDDELTPDALYEVVRIINKTHADFIYSDEDFITKEGRAIHAHFKPDFSPDLLLSHNYITHFTVIKRTLLDLPEVFRSRFDSAQDYDLFLRTTEKASHIAHIPKVLYHWRMLESSTSSGHQAKPKSVERGRQALKEALQRRKITGEVLPANLPNYYRVKRDIRGVPFVSIIIPFKDKPELLETCIGSILEKSTYKNFEIIGMSNNSEKPETYAMMKRLGSLDSRVVFHEYSRPFNYSEINNYAVRHYAHGEHVLLLNNDIEIISPDWIEALLEHSQRPEIGCVGAKLYYEDGTIQHAGAIIGLGGYVAHSHRGLPGNSHGYFNRLNVIQNLSAVTGACLMVKKALYLEVGGMDETHLKIAYNDIDFCLRIRERGYLNLFTPYCEAYHYESKSRGDDNASVEKQRRFEQEKAYLRNRHPIVETLNDPYYNPNLTLDAEDFSLR